MCERKRIKFIKCRDGTEEAQYFAKRTMGLYRAAVLKSSKRGFANPHHASLKEYRRGFINSYLSFKRYLKSNPQCS